MSVTIDRDNLLANYRLEDSQVSLCFHSQWCTGSLLSIPQFTSVSVRGWPSSRATGKKGAMTPKWFHCVEGGINSVSDRDIVQLGDTRGVWPCEEGAGLSLSCLITSLYSAYR